MSQNFIGSEDFKVRNGLIVGNNFMVVNVVSGTVSVNSSNSSVSLYLNSTDGIQLPVGNTAARPAMANGVIRYNSTLSTHEYVGNGNWNPLFNIPFNSGRLQVVDKSGSGLIANNLISFVPYNGNYIKVNGQVYQIPANGIVANALSCFINGVANQNFGNSTSLVATQGANTTYWGPGGGANQANNLFYVYVFNNNGTPALDFCSTGHSTSATAGNIGTEIKTGDDTRTLVGMVWPFPTNGSGSFLGFNNFYRGGGGIIQRNMASWFNRQLITMSYGVSDGTINDSNWHTEIQNYGLLWADDLTVYMSGFQVTEPNGTTGFNALMLDLNAGFLRGLGNFTTTDQQYNQSVYYFTNGMSVIYSDFNQVRLKEGINGFSALYTVSSTGNYGFQTYLQVTYRA